MEILIVLLLVLAIAMVSWLGGMLYERDQTIRRGKWER